MGKRGDGERREMGKKRGGREERDRKIESREMEKKRGGREEGDGKKERREMEK